MEIIYLYEVHNLPWSMVAKRANVNYSTVRTIASVYQKTGGRYNKLLTYMTKKSILDKRQQENYMLRNRRKLN